MSSQSLSYKHQNDLLKLGNDQTSKNPYCQGLALPAPALATSVSKESQLSVPGRPKPPRTVFYDLSTAHSSITSRTTRNRYRIASNNISKAYEEEDSIPLQDFDALKRKNAAPPASSFELPLPPPAATIRTQLNKRSTDSDACTEAEDNRFASERVDQSREKQKQNQYQLNGPSVYHSSIRAQPSSLPPNSTGDGLPLNSYNRPQNQRHDSHKSAIPFPYLRSTSVENKTSPPLSNKSSKLTRVWSDASLREGSTVANIYQHYVGSEIFDGADSDGDYAPREFDLADSCQKTLQFGVHAIDNCYPSSSLPNNQSQPSALVVRKQRRAERVNVQTKPPACALPGLPDPLLHLPPGSSCGIGPSSSYGDTQKLLDLTEQSKVNNCNEAFNDFLSPLNNPSEDMRPLERDISQQLRRATNLSAYSDGSIATSVMADCKPLHSEPGRGILTSHIENSLCPDPELDEKIQAATNQVEAFYDQQAIPPTWIAKHRRNMVRIPIHNNHPLPKSLPTSSSDEVDDEHRASGKQNMPGDDANENDWETVGESGFDECRGSTPAMLGGEMAHRAGSSIADTSDDGSMSTLAPEISDFGSTERIAQHPGCIQYSGDYRQRELKNSNIPVFLPVYGEHKVNGYLADSNRLRAPRNPFNHTPSPLHRKHMNPFKSPPPEFIKKPNKPYSSHKRQRRPPIPNSFPAQPSFKTCSSSDGTEIAEYGTAPSHITRSRPVENFSRPFTSNWMDDFGDPGPAIARKDFLKPIPHVAESEDCPSSWQQIIAIAEGNSVADYNDDGIRNTSRSMSGGIFKEVNTYGCPFTPTAIENETPTDFDGFIEQKTYGGKHEVTNLQERNTLVKGPPGAFYHGLSCSKANALQTHGSERLLKRKGKGLGHQSSANTKSGSGLRQLSLVNRHNYRPEMPLNASGFIIDIGPDPSLSREPNDFVYRSPLAPPKRRTWQQMYTQTQLSSFRAAKEDGNSESHELRATNPNHGLLGSRGSVTEDSSQQHLWEEPRLKGNRNAANQIFAVQPKKKRMISIVVLCLCNLFFPLLLPYVMGQLDWVMDWWTTGEYHSLGSPQKRCALFCFIGWILAGFLALIATLVWFFALR